MESHNGKQAAPHLEAQNQKQTHKANQSIMSVETFY